MNPLSSASNGPTSSATPPIFELGGVELDQGSTSRTFFYRAQRSRRLVVGASLIVFVVLVAIFAPFIAPYSPLHQAPQFNDQPPFWHEPNGALHILGTDPLGRDVLSRIIYGARVSLIIGSTAVLLSGSLGVLLGLLAGFFGGIVETVIMRLVDTQLAIPFILLAIVAVALFGQSLVGLVIILALTSWLGYARIVRGVVLSLKEMPYVEAAYALGASPLRTIFKHIFPGVWTPVIVVATQQVGAMMIAESSLSFLGIGVPPTVPSWGAMIADGRSYIQLAWWVSTLPGLALLITVLAVYFFGDGLRDVLDPRLRL
ncbi:MAG TPA: ABC transporter permease [Chloroflexota bacterium]|nr:ABC transporter permease [Chloroflexota bacterium]